VLLLLLPLLPGVPSSVYEAQSGGHVRRACNALTRLMPGQPCWCG